MAPIPERETILIFNFLNSVLRLADYPDDLGYG